MSKIKETSVNFENKAQLGLACTSIFAINLIGGQWTMMICCQLLRGKKRFGELRKQIPNITERMLTLQLRKMEENKLLTRKVYAEVPPKVEYELTPIGLKLKCIMDELDNWGLEYSQDTVPQSV